MHFVRKKKEGRPKRGGTKKRDWKAGAGKRGAGHKVPKKTRGEKDSKVCLLKA